MDYTTIANSGIVWVLCGITVFVALFQAILYFRMAKVAVKEINLDPAIPNKALRIGLISAVGPALGVFIVMVGLMASIGGPMAWMRLSIIGAAATELTAATLGAQAAGVTLGSPEFTLEIMAVTWFAMALNGAGWLVVTGIFTPGLEKVRGVVSGGDVKWLAALSGACSLGIFGYLNTNEIVQSTGKATASLVGAFSMVFLVKVIVPKCPKLSEYSLGIAMLLGMAAAVVCDMIVA